MKTRAAKTLCFLISFILIAMDAYCRAGGAGGSHSSSSSHGFGGGGGSFGGSHGIGVGTGIGLSGGNVGIIILIIVVFIVIAVIKKRGSGGTDLESGQSDGPQGIPEPISPEFINANQGFDQQTFIRKVGTAFMAIQDAWQKKDLSKVRKWITDGVYQRFNAQFTMMKMLEQTNTLSNINIKQIRIESATQEGEYSIITASVYFRMDDNFICNKASEFNERFNGDETTEYWTFIKKTSAAEKDLYHSTNCPKCGYPSNDKGGQVSQCESCGTVTYLGDYDWVLCEITQEDDYNRGNYRIDKSDPSLQPLYADREFSIQLMEDKASNAIMQYFTSKATHDLKYVKRFTSDDLFAKIEQQLKNEGKFIFNRLFLNSVDLVSCTQVSDVYWCTFNIFYSSMRLQETPGGGLKKIDDTVIERVVQLSLGKKVGATQKTKLWSFACPSCGAPYTDTTITDCTYCGAKINSTDNDWVMLMLNDAN